VEYRFRLGKTLGSDIITDGTFVSALGVNWIDEDLGGTWSIAANKATHAGATYNYLNQDCGFVPGVKYKIPFTVSDIPGGGSDYVQVYLSGFSITTNSDNNFYKDSNGTFTVEGTCLSTDSHIRFMAFGTASISNVSALPYDWNTPLTNHPTNWDESGISLIKSELLEGFYVKYLGNLKFWGDGYDYLLSKYNTLSSQSPKEFCELIYLKIERYVSGAWEEHFTGVIYMNKATLSYKNKTVACNVEDIASSQVIKFGADKVLGISYQNRNVYDSANTFDFPSTICGVKNGAGGVNDKTVYFLFKVLRQIVHEITDLSVTIDSDLLLTTPYDGVANVFQFLGITPFKNFALTDPTYTCYASFKELTDDLNVIRNIGGLSSYANNIPTLNIESKDILNAGDYSFTIDNNVSEFDFFEENNWQNIDIGFVRPNSDDEIYASSYEVDNWYSANYYSRTKCTEQSLTLQSHTGANGIWISQQLGDNIFDPSTGLGLQAPFTPRNFWLQMEIDAPGPPVTYKSIFGLIGVLTINNPDLITNHLMDRHVTTLNSSFTSEVWGDATKTNNPLIRTWSFETPITLDDLKEIIANPNYFLSQTSGYFSGSISGQILEFEYKNKADSQGKNIAKFKIISE